MRSIKLGFVSLLLAGCVSTGVQVRQDQVAQLEKGVTTEADVVRQFGKATTSMWNPDGTKTLIYSYVHAQARPATFIPLIGGLVGGSDTQANMTILRFDRDGKFISAMASESEYGVGTGFAANAPVPAMAQPGPAKP